MLVIPKYDLYLLSHLSIALTFVKFLAAVVLRNNDRYLDELRAVLEDRCGTSVSDVTIWRTLHRIGFRLKEASHPSFAAFRLSSAMYFLD